MSEDLDEFLRDVAGDNRVDVEVRDMAQKVLHNWDRGIIPTPGQIRKIRKKIPRPSLCVRLLHDGSCAWLQRNARTVGLQIPQPGEKLICKRSTHGPEHILFSSCPGYIRPDDG